MHLHLLLVPPATTILCGLPAMTHTEPVRACSVFRLDMVCGGFTIGFGNHSCYVIS